MQSFIQTKEFSVEESSSKNRLDIFLTIQMPEYSRSFFKNLISEGHVTVNDSVVPKAGLILSEKDKIIVKIPDLLAIKNSKNASEIDAKIVHDHSDFLIIYKSAGVLVHAPNDKCDQITLVDWLIEKFKDISNVGSPDRPGIVHRLDMDTSGIMIIPRTNLAHKIFGDLFKDRQIHKTYLAIVVGHPPKTGTIDLDIVRHPSIKTKMTHVTQRAAETQKFKKPRHATTNYKVLVYYQEHSLVEIKPITGRTHQIRVHMAAIGHPLLGDGVYGKQSHLINRHALHAARLEFEYKGQKYCFDNQLPADMDSLISNFKPYSTP